MGGKRLGYIAIGILATTVAIIGVWLPGVPTVFPLLIALWAFSRSSTYLYKKLTTMPLLRTALREARAYEKTRSLTRQTKLISQGSAWTSVVAMIFITRNIWIVMAVLVLAISCSVFMKLIPTRTEEYVDEADTSTDTSSR